MMPRVDVSFPSRFFFFKRESRFYRCPAEHYQLYSGLYIGPFIDNCLLTRVFAALMRNVSIPVD